MIKSVEINKLFGTFDYKIEFPEYGEVLILTGPNGYGKTTIISIIEAIANGDLLFFYTLPFESLSIQYDGCVLKIISIDESEVESGDDAEVKLHKSLSFALIKDQETFVQNVDEKKIDDARETYKWKEWNEREYDLPFEYGIEKLNRSNSKTQNQKLLSIIASKEGNQEFFITLNSVKEQSRFIPAQRLYKIEENNNKNYIEIVSEKIKNYLKKHYFNFLRTSQRHDSQFIKMLLSGHESISESEYNQKLKELNEVIKISSKYDLTERIELPQYNPEKSEILNYYIKDVLEKYSVYETPLSELGLFDQLLSKKKLVNKEIKYSRTKGIGFLSKGKKFEIPLDALSSGETNQIVMLHDFIFNLPDKSILMIDEPEISLHVAWQHEFMDDIIQIAKLKSLRVIIATHSPQIVGGRWNLCYDLYYNTHK